MPRLFLFDTRVRNVVPNSQLVPPPPDIYHETSVNERLNSVITRLSPQLGGHRIDGILLIAHGNSGHLQFTADGLSASNVQAFTAWRGRVHGFVRIHGCAVASATTVHLYTTVAMNMGQQRATPGTLTPPMMNFSRTLSESASAGELDGATSRAIRANQGVRFLIAFASAIGLTVTGAMHAQQPDSAGGWRFQGPTISASPGGSLLLQVPRNSVGFSSNTAGSFTVGW
jgi:hypothetical protein